MTDIRATENGIVFQFEENVNVHGMFNENKANDLIYLLASPNESTNKPRWAKVVATGPAVRECKVDDRILIHNAMWTISFVVNGKKFWKTDEKQVLAIAEKVA